MKVYSIAWWPPNAGAPGDPPTLVGPFTDRHAAEQALASIATRPDVGTAEIMITPHRPTVTIHVDAAQAVHERSGACGPIAVRLSSADLDTLTPAQRDTLEKHLAGMPGPFADGPAWGDPIAHHAPPVGRADLPTLRTLLAHRLRVLLDAFERATAEGLPIFTVERSGSSVPNLDARNSRSVYLYSVERRQDATVRRVDGVLVARPEYMQTYREGDAFPEIVDVRANRAWHRAATKAGAR